NSDSYLSVLALIRGYPKIVERDADFIGRTNPTTFAYSHCGCFLHTGRISRSQKLDELLDSPLGARPNITQDRYDILPNGRMFHVAAQGILEQLNERLNYFVGHGSPFAILVVLQGTYCLTSRDAIAFVQCVDVILEVA